LSTFIVFNDTFLATGGVYQSLKDFGDGMLREALLLTHSLPAI